MIWGGCAEAVLNQRIRSTTLVDFFFFNASTLYLYAQDSWQRQRATQTASCRISWGEWQSRPADASPTPTSHPPQFPFILRNTACSVCKVLSCLSPPSRPGLKTKGRAPLGAYAGNQVPTSKPILLQPVCEMGPRQGEIHVGDRVKALVIREVFCLA